MKRMPVLSGPFLLALVAVASNPCPAAWLDDTTYDVGVEDILAPKGTVDSGQTIIPRCVVANYGDSTAGFWTFFHIDDGTPYGYSDSLWLPGLAPSQRETLAFSAWVPRGRDSMEAIAWTECAGDTFPADDTCRQRFLVRVRDIAIIAILKPAPDTTYDSGVTFYPQCLVWNYGSPPFDTVVVNFCIGSYVSACTLYAGHSETATALDPYTTMPGVWACQVWAFVVGDLHPENNMMIDTFTVRGTIVCDVAVTGLWQDSTGLIRGVMANLGDNLAMFWAFQKLRDSAGSALFDESTQVTLWPSDSTEMIIPTAGLPPGLYVAACSVSMSGDQNSTNDVKRLWFRVNTGVEEGQPQATSFKPQATVLSGSMVHSLSSKVLFDATGRRVLSPKPGVYFVAEYSVVSSQHSGTVDGARNTVHVRKVILQR